MTKERTMHCIVRSLISDTCAQYHPTEELAQSHILCKRKTVHFENIDHYDETGKKDVGLICILPRSCSSVKRG